MSSIDQNKIISDINAFTDIAQGAKPPRGQSVGSIIGRVKEYVTDKRLSLEQLEHLNVVIEIINNKANASENGFGVFIKYSGAKSEPLTLSSIKNKFKNLGNYLKSIKLPTFKSTQNGRPLSSKTTTLSKLFEDTRTFIEAKQALSNEILSAILAVRTQKLHGILDHIQSLNSVFNPQLNDWIDQQRLEIDKGDPAILNDKAKLQERIDSYEKKLLDVLLNTFKPPEIESEITKAEQILTFQKQQDLLKQLRKIKPVSKGEQGWVDANIQLLKNPQNMSIVMRNLTRFNLDKNPLQTYNGINKETVVSAQIDLLKRDQLLQQVIALQKTSKPDPWFNSTIRSLQDQNVKIGGPRINLDKIEKEIIKIQAKNKIDYINNILMQVKTNFEEKPEDIHGALAPYLEVMAATQQKTAYLKKEFVPFFTKSSLFTQTEKDEILGAQDLYHIPLEEPLISLSNVFDFNARIQLCEIYHTVVFELAFLEGPLPNSLLISTHPNSESLEKSIPDTIQDLKMGIRQMILNGNNKDEIHSYITKKIAGVSDSQSKFRLKAYQGEYGKLNNLLKMGIDMGGENPTGFLSAKYPYYAFAQTVSQLSFKNIEEETRVLKSLVSFIDAGQSIKNPEIDQHIHVNLIGLSLKEIIENPEKAILILNKLNNKMIQIAAIEFEVTGDPPASVTPKNNDPADILNLQNRATVQWNLILFLLKQTQVGIAADAFLSKKFEKVLHSTSLDYTKNLQDEIKGLNELLEDYLHFSNKCQELRKQITKTIHLVGESGTKKLTITDPKKGRVVALNQIAEVEKSILAIESHAAAPVAPTLSSSKASNYITELLSKPDIAYNAERLEMLRDIAVSYVEITGVASLTERVIGQRKGVADAMTKMRAEKGHLLLYKDESGIEHLVSEMVDNFGRMAVEGIEETVLKDKGGTPEQRAAIQTLHKNLKTTAPDVLLKQHYMDLSKNMPSTATPQVFDLMGSEERSRDLLMEKKLDSLVKQLEIPIKPLRDLFAQNIEQELYKQASVKDPGFQTFEEELLSRINIWNVVFSDQTFIANIEAATDKIERPLNEIKQNIKKIQDQLNVIDSDPQAWEARLAGLRDNASREKTKAGIQSLRDKLHSLENEAPQLFYAIKEQKHQLFLKVAAL